MIFPSVVLQRQGFPAPDSLPTTLKEILKTIDELEDEQRITFTMFIEGYKYKEIAEELDIPLGTVKKPYIFHPE